jgi:phage shock protein A
MPGEADVASLAREAAERKQQLTRDVDAARRAGDAATMHRLLMELAALDKELADLDAATRAARAAGVKPGTPGAAPPPRPASTGPAGARPRPAEDPLARLKQQAEQANRRSSASVDDELAALKRKMSETSKKK